MCSWHTVIDNHMSSRPHLPLRGRLTGPNLASRAAGSAAAAAAPVPLPAVALDPLTAVDNHAYYTALGTARNLPENIADALAALRPH